MNASIVLLVLAAACEPVENPIPPPPPQTAEQFARYTYDSVDIVDHEGSLLVALVDGAGNDNAGIVAGNVAANAAARFTPAGCAVATVDGPSATVTVEFHGCAGPRGLQTIGGGLSLTINSNTNANTIELAAVSSELDFDSAAEIVYADSNATYAVAASGTASLTVNTASHGGTSRHELELGGSYSLAWTATCRTLGGAWTTRIDFNASSYTGTTAASAIVRCDATCPASGTATTHDFDDVNITFDGSAAPAFESYGSAAGSVALPCAP